ncbi:MAG TPA: nucleotide exchange factor GrpE, partial [Patescibacteria group bacterium]|nr:nucleotide exchange factor GrpE [Patescibacteria group bacterium]
MTIKGMENKNERYKIAVAQKALFYDNGTKKFLLLKSKNQKEYYFKLFGAWEIPGGKLEENESLKDSFSREVSEEMGEVDFEIICPINARNVMFEWGPMLLVDYLVKYNGGDIKLNEEHDEFRWETVGEIEKNKEYGTWLKNLVKKAEEIIKKEEYLSGWKRCQADFENYKKRQQENLKDTRKYACQSVVMEILPVLDNFYASTDHIPGDQEKSPWVTGIMHIQKQLEKVLQDNEVREIKIKKGDK